MRPRLATAFALDQRLSRIIAQATEPLLAQMRLAWWRDQLAKPVAERPSGDAVLDAIGEHWAGEEGSLSAMVNGWEQMLADPPLPRDVAQSFAQGRAAPVIRAASAGAAKSDAAVDASAQLWALVDAAAHVSQQQERELLLDLARECSPRLAPLPRSLRGLFVLAGLAQRALDRDDPTLMTGRGAALKALRLGIFGR